MNEQTNTENVADTEVTATNVTAAKPEGDERAVHDPTPDTDHNDDRRLVGEAKKYRQRAQAAEAERDKLQEALTAARGIILTDYIRKAGMLHPEDFQTLTGITCDDCFTENGEVDDGMVDTAISKLERARPEMFRRKHSLPPTNPPMNWRKPAGGEPDPLAAALSRR